MGNKVVRYIFVDEAGTSKPEPCTVVIGVIANADEHLMRAESMFNEAIKNGVPEQLQDDYVFHATDVYSNRKYREFWSLDSRLEFISSILSIPRQLKMSVSVSLVWRDSVEYGADDVMLPHKLDHLASFGQCLFEADRYIRENCGSKEAATVVAEDVPEMKKRMKDLPLLFKRKSADPAYDERFRITRIRNSVHFVEKDEDPLVQVADACAFGLRRYFIEKTHGEIFSKALLGGDGSQLSELKSRGDGVAGGSNVVSWNDN